MAENQIQTVQPSIPVVNGQLVPSDFNGIQRLASFMFQTGMVPLNERNPCTLPQTILLVAKALEVGLPFTQISSGLMIVRNKPAVWGDTALALVLSSPHFGGISETFDAATNTAKCRIIRRVNGAEMVTERTFSEGNARKAGLWGKSGPWTQYPERMLQMRARGFALRDAFADALNGLGIVEEVRDIEPVSQHQSSGSDLTTTILNLDQPAITGSIVTNADPQDAVFADLGTQIVTETK